MRSALRGAAPPQASEDFTTYVERLEALINDPDFEFEYCLPCSPPDQIKWRVEVLKRSGKLVETSRDEKCTDEACRDDACTGKGSKSDDRKDENARGKRDDSKDDNATGKRSWIGGALWSLGSTMADAFVPQCSCHQDPISVLLAHGYSRRRF
mmetsp:Transcript_101140/g.159501  ORF Transcript_101140/g.159501 Transcript_101140/m.159501 type:complete len:153 (-) Transcript_101140:6-464(-)